MDAADFATRMADFSEFADAPLEVGRLDAVPLFTSFKSAPHLVQGMLRHPRTLEAAEAIARGRRRFYEDDDILIARGMLVIKNLATCDAEQVKVVVSVLPKLRVVACTAAPDTRASHAAMQRLCTFLPAVVVRCGEHEGVYPAAPGKAFAWQRVASHDVLDSFARMAV